MDTNFSLIFDFILDYYGTSNIFWIFYVLNLIFGALSFQLGFARKLPLIKTIFVYIMLAVGTYILTIFSILKLPITESLLVVAIVLAIYRLRLYKQRQAKE
ncbi:YlaH-like family protein [Virgibacillus sp. C22-A2]|uniref:YlaH-like family protein n=1 Tax=Virgibacillus tibetensis TaxID=3042313 RepID=A0ABU6KBX7_9BACI|nr:YlaH-like family protein [Virgibacillus sp. C22-A2]